MSVQLLEVSECFLESTVFLKKFN